ncbi:MAG: phosphate ABC transporter substrate-binding protein PstS [Acidobacteriia bacterium]|nr:phosphate ABC transporter substrate-binding protein PstS [Terriglobia bacterium]
MQRIILRCVVLVMPIVMIAVSGCSSTSGAPKAETITITGAGSTFVTPIMSKWIDEYHQSHPNVQVNYQSIGSGGGIKQLQNNLVDFGASDAALSDEQLKSMPALIQIAESAGPVCVTYNLPDLKQPLKLTPAVLSGIYLGTIKSWRDPALVKSNPGVKFPDEPIVVVHRSDGSGTTNIFTTYLTEISPAWAKKAGKGLSVNWPVGLGGKGSEGVTAIVKQSEGGIGYVELNYASQNHLPVADVQNKAGEWVSPSTGGATAAIDAFKDKLDTDLRSSIVEPPPAARNAYPISGMTYLLIPKDAADRNKREALKDFVQYIITSGQQMSTQLEYSQIPQSLEQVDEKRLSELTTGGQAL